MSAVKKIGFSQVVEVAKGAEITAANESDELEHRLQEGAPFMTSSCCPSYVEAARKHIPGILPFVSDTGSPMYYIAELMRKEKPHAKLVFIGPCIAKRKEALDNVNVDYVLSFEELDSMFEALHIKPSECEAAGIDEITAEARGFALSGGVIQAIKKQELKIDVKTLSVDGLNKNR
jgi:iron only hydrogenase large subunit-like protein